MIKLLLNNRVIPRRLNNTGSTLFEVMMMLIVLSTVLLSLFEVLSQGIRFAKDTEMRIQAINLAREWIEWVTNIRNTNWLRYSSDRKHCWDTLKYDPACIWNAAPSNIISLWWYTLYMQQGLWFLSGTTSWNDNDWAGSFARFQIFSDDSGWYNGTGSTTLTTLCTNVQTTNCKTPFAREIVISNKTSTGMTVTANIYWYNSAPRKISITSELTNWKSLYD